MIILRSAADWFSESKWVMELDPDAIADVAGKTIKWQGESFVDYPLPRAKKLLKLILQYGNSDDIDECDKAFVRNPKLWKAWNELKTRYTS